MGIPPPGSQGAKKPAASLHPVVLADAKLTVNAPIPRVFEALVNPEQVARWWAADVRIEAELGGRYEGTLPEGRIEGTITAIDGPGRLAYLWPMDRESGPIETSVAYELSPKGPQTFIHLLHRSPFPVPGHWNAVWQRALESLRAFVEDDTPTAV